MVYHRGMFQTKHFAVLVASILGSILIVLFTYGDNAGSSETASPEHVLFSDPEEVYAVDSHNLENDTLERNRFIERVRSTLPASAIRATTEPEPEISVSSEPDPLPEEPAIVETPPIPEVIVEEQITTPVSLPLGAVTTTTPTDEEPPVQTATNTGATSPEI